MTDREQFEAAMSAYCDPAKVEETFYREGDGYESYATLFAWYAWQASRATPADHISQARDAWQPIETAPKDGCMFLGWVDAVRYGESDEGVQFETNVSEHDFCRWNERDGYVENMMGQIGDAYHVTHWRPLPAPPEKPAGDVSDS